MAVSELADVKRKRADWMRPIDDLLLEELHSTGNLQPAEIAERIGRSRKYSGERCRKLREHGLVRNMGHGTYSITEQGIAYLKGEADASELNPPD